MTRPALPGGYDSVSARHRWLFSIEDSEGDTHYVDAEGKGKHADEFYLGTSAEAAREADRRATAWENLPGNGWPMVVTYEAHGIVP